MKQDLVCECGHKRFYVSSDGKVAMCSKCGTIYDKKGIEFKTIEVDAPSVKIGGNVGDIYNYAKEKMLNR